MIASKILSMFRIDHLEYSLKTIDKRKASACKCMVNRDIEFLTASYIFDTEMNKNKNPYRQYVDICKKTAWITVQKNWMK